MKKEYQVLKDLSMLAGVPGNEKNVSKYLSKEIKPFADEVIYDNLGSVIAIKKHDGPKVMIAGHMDEVGLFVTQVTKDGFVKFQTLGGWFSQVMLAQVWEIHTNKKGIVYGVTGVKPPHIIPADKRNVAIAIDTMYLDIGVSSKEEAENLGIEPGNMIVPHAEFMVLGNEKYLLGKAWDNRIGSAVVLEVMKRLKDVPNEVFATFTVQEEVGLRGAKTSSYVVEPEIAIAVDTGLAIDVPQGDPSEQSLGKGPQILLYDAGLVPNQALRQLVIETAKENNIPYQEAVITGGRTDAGHMHLAHRGAAGLSIGIPTRYMHSHTSIIHYDDYENTVKLVLEVLKKLDRKTVDHILYE